jgi:hypothetical protein
MKRLILAVALAAGTALAGCAQLKEISKQNADAGATGVEQQRPYPKSSSDMGLF